MAQRTVALYNGKYIGIEIIYTVIGGKQINIPEKLKDLRQKSQNNELFCPCGCGANLILVAGDKNLREQHFRIKDAESYPDCHVVTEGKTSVDSKIVLKCWLDDNLHSDDLESRVPISSVEDINRKYEFTFISRSNRLAVNYCYNRANLSDEKLNILEANGKGISIIHVVDQSNGGTEGQYQEGLMKVQDRQGYCLLLSIEESDYEKAEMKAVFYERDLDDLWQEIIIADGKLKQYRILAGGDIFFGNKSLKELFEIAKTAFDDENEQKRIRRIEIEQKRQEYLRLQELERQRRIEESRREQEEADKRRRAQEEENARLRAELEERQRIEKERKEQELRKHIEALSQNFNISIETCEELVKDSVEKRLIKCEFCGKIADESEFVIYGGPGRGNLGTCRDCNKNNPAAKQRTIPKPLIERKTYNPHVCPECGGILRERNGRNGKFIGCSNYPRCRYTRNA